MASMAYACSSSTWNLSSIRAALPSPSRPSISFPNRSSVSQPRTTLRKTTLCNSPNSFVGLAPVNPLHFFQGLMSFDQFFPAIDNGGRVSCMRHGRKVPKLNRPPDQRRALLRGLTTQLLKYGLIKTTRARASALRKYIDKMITLAKDGSLHKRRQTLFINEKQIVHALFAEVDERY